MNACTGLADDTACGNSSRGSGERRTGSLNLSNVRLVPGATSAPSGACLPADNSPIWTNLTALAARRSTSPVRSRRLLLALKIAACWNQSTTWRSVKQHSWNQQEQFPRSDFRVSSPCARAAMHSSNATLSAAVKAPFRKLGTVRMTTARQRKIACKSRHPNWPCPPRPHEPGLALSGHPQHQPQCLQPNRQRNLHPRRNSLCWNCFIRELPSTSTAEPIAGS